MEPAVSLAVTLVIFIIIVRLALKGVIKTFRRNDVVAIWCLIFLTPIWIIWAIVEVFTGPIEQ